MMKLQESPIEFYWIESPTGDQAADKYLIALFAADAAINGASCKYVVVSADKGFDPCVQLVGLTFRSSTKRKMVLQGASPTRSKKLPPPAQPRTNASNKPTFDRFTNHRDSMIRVLGQIEGLRDAEKHKVANAYLEYLKSGRQGGRKHLVYCALQNVLGANRGQEIY